MHLILLLCAFGFAWSLRCSWVQRETSWHDRWQWTLSLFLLPPLLLMSSAIAVLWMGPYGQMVWDWEGWVSYGIALSFSLSALLGWVRSIGEGHRVMKQVQACPTVNQDGKVLRILDLPMPFSAQVGFWNSELIVTQGMLKTLSGKHLEAVFIHEQAHAYYRDTFWFFWLGWLRCITFWLPQTESLWQELLVLRELRADQWAAQQVDSLLLAEALLLVVQNISVFPENICAAFCNQVASSRLTQRIEALLAEKEPIAQTSLWTWMGLCAAFLPLAIIPLHY